jgi:hypothetical protein
VKIFITYAKLNNFTTAAQEKNAETLLIIRDPALAAQDTQN